MEPGIEPLAFAPPGGAPPDVVLRAREESQEDYRARMLAQREKDQLAESQARQAIRREQRAALLREWSTNAMELGGATMVAYGFWQWHHWLGWVVGGVLLIVLALLASLPEGRASRAADTQTSTVEQPPRQPNPGYREGP